MLSLRFRLVRRRVHEHADAPHAFGLLCMRGARPNAQRDRSAHTLDEVAPLHSRLASCGRCHSGWRDDNTRPARQHDRIDAEQIEVTSSYHAVGHGPAIVRTCRLRRYRFGLHRIRAGRIASATTAVNAACQWPLAASSGGSSPGDRGKRLREGRDPRRGLPAAEMAAPRLRPEPELDQRSRSGATRRRRCREQRQPRRCQRQRQDERREHQRDAADHRFDLGADDTARRHRRGRDQVGRVLARDREPGEAAGELARRHHQHRHEQHQIVAVRRRNSRHSISAGGSR